MNVLFICNQNKHRSKTTAHLFKDLFTTKSAGLYCTPPLSLEELRWADVVVVMEEAQRGELAKRFPAMFLQKRVLNFAIPDVFRFGQPELVVLLKQKVNQFVQTCQKTH